MKVEDIVGYSTRAIKERYLRSALTILMVLLGAMLLTGLNGLGEGFNYNIQKESTLHLVLSTFSTQWVQPYAAMQSVGLGSIKNNRDLFYDM